MTVVNRSGYLRGVETWLGLRYTDSCIKDPLVFNNVCTTGVLLRRPHLDSFSRGVQPAAAAGRPCVRLRTLGTEYSCPWDVVNSV